MLAKFPANFVIFAIYRGNRSGKCGPILPIFELDLDFTKIFAPISIIFTSKLVKILLLKILILLWGFKVGIGLIQI